MPNSAANAEIRRDIITAVPVAFRSDGTLDLDGSREILSRVAESGNDGALVLGTTGEFVALDFVERGALTTAALEILSPHMRVVVHVGAASAFEVRRNIEQARNAGATEIAILTPYYLRASQQAIIDFYTTVVVDCAGLDVYVYVFPQVTGNIVEVETMAALSRLPHIVGAKISGEALDRVLQYRRVVPQGFVLYTGADRDLVRATGFGAQGVISGISSVYPKPFLRLREVLQGGSADQIAAAQEHVEAAIDALGSGNLGRMKTALRLDGVHAGVCRMPIANPTDDEIAELTVANAKFL